MDIKYLKEHNSTMNRFEETITDALNEAINNEKLIRKRLRQLNRYKGRHLESTKYGNKLYYTQRMNTSGANERKYLGDSENHTVKCIQEYRYLEEALIICQRNIHILKKTLQQYEDINSEMITSRLSRSYHTEDMSIEKVVYGKTSSSWKNELESKKASAGPFKPEGLRHRTSDGTLVRSLSEMVIYKELASLGIPFVYEPPYYIGGKLYRPDFVALQVEENREIVIELLGMLANPTYAEDNMQKLMQYYASGYILGDNLLIFVDDINGSLDALTVRRILKSRF